jgi:hypothetical protein
MPFHPMPHAPIEFGIPSILVRRPPSFDAVFSDRPKNVSSSVAPDPSTPHSLFSPHESGILSFGSTREYAFFSPFNPSTSPTLFCCRLASRAEQIQHHILQSTREDIFLYRPDL